MSTDVTETSSVEPDLELVNLLVQEHLVETVPILERLWDYYRNEMIGDGISGSVGRLYRLGQEQGLPLRLVGTSNIGSLHIDQQQREIVIENDIAWRIHTLVDFMFGKPLSLQSCAPDGQRAEVIEHFLRQVFESNGGVGFFQDIALLGSVYGHVDILLRVLPPEGRANHSRNGILDKKQLIDDAHKFVLEIVEAPRAVPVLNPDDYRKIDSYIIHYRQVLNQVEDSGFLSRIRNGVFGNSSSTLRRSILDQTQVWHNNSIFTFQGEIVKKNLVEQIPNRLGRIPVVHIQNLPQPFFYEGLSEVEPLIPLQDELNTRLSDRANRVTFQSFKMYLGKGIEHFTERPVGPGQMWSTDNLEADIQEFGGDHESPSEDIHIKEIREAMDKASTVAPVAAGVVQDRLGNLTSGNALRVTLMGLMAKTERKRVTYGTGIKKICEMILHTADIFGVLPNSPEERVVRLDWPSMLPENESERLRDSRLKLELGVPQKQILAELGYGDCIDTV